MHQHFPFSAVQGQAEFKLALILSAINPRIGGVLISGPRGSAKTTLARAMADLLPGSDETFSGSGDTSPSSDVASSSAGSSPSFVTLPLGASEEMLVGSLNLNKVLTDKQVDFQPGLLGRAHGGVLYVDEVNLLPDNLVDVLLDVSASGRNFVERDGISHEHAARFLLVGTMNPDEGELRPQLQDRFGLALTLNNQYDAPARVAIVKAREAFEDNPSAFIKTYRDSQDQLRQQIITARAALPTITCADELRLAIAERCASAQVDGLRADLVWYRAALAHAAWRGAEQVSKADVDAVAELVLHHRRRVADSGSGPDSNKKTNTKPDSKQESGPDSDVANNSQDDQRNELPQRPNNGDGKNNGRGGEGGGFKRPEASYRSEALDFNLDQNLDPKQDQNHQHEAEQTEQTEQNGQEGETWGAMQPQQASHIAKQHIDLSMLSASPSGNSTTAQKVATPLQSQGAAFLSTTGTIKGKKGANLSARGRTLVRPKNKAQSVPASLDWFATLTKSLGEWPPKSLIPRKQRLSNNTLHVVLIDNSASSLSDNSFAHAKGALAELAGQAYLKREQLAVFGFGHSKVEALMAQVRAPKQIETWLKTLAAGGGTPMRAGLEHMASYIAQARRKEPYISMRAYVISDGRSRAQVDDISLDCECVWIDAEQAALARGRGPELAQQLGALYVSLKQTMTYRQAFQG